MTITFNDIVELVAGCRRLGIVFTLSGSKLKCAAPAGTMSAELQSVIAAHPDKIWAVLFSETEPAADNWPAVEFADDSKPSPAPAEWPAEVGALADLVMLLSVDDLPPAPFDFGPGRVVVDPQSFLGSFQSDVRHGATGPRALLGSLQDDLRRLRNMVIEKATISQLALLACVSSIGYK